MHLCPQIDVPSVHAAIQILSLENPATSVVCRYFCQIFCPQARVPPELSQETLTVATIPTQFVTKLTWSVMSRSAWRLEPGVLEGFLANPRPVNTGARELAAVLVTQTQFVL